MSFFIFSNASQLPDTVRSTFYPNIEKIFLPHLTRGRVSGSAPAFEKIKYFIG